MAIQQTSPETFVFIEWNEKTQTLHFNDVSKKKVRHPLNTSGFEPIIACLDSDQAMIIATFVENVILKRIKKNENISTKDMKFLMNQLSAFSEKMAKSALKNWPMIMVPNS